MRNTSISPKPKAPIPPASSSSPVQTRAKLFRNGRSQAVRLPKEFRFEGTEVAIRRDPVTGEVILSSRTELRENAWEERFAAWDAMGAPDEDVLERDQTPPVEREFF